MASQLTSMYPNLYSFFTGWDDGRKADIEDAAAARTQKRFDLELPSLNLEAEKATSELDNYLLNSEVRKRQQQFSRDLAGAQVAAREKLLPDWLSTINEGETLRLRGTQQGLTGQALAQDSAGRILALRQQYPEATDAQLRKIYAELFGLGITPSGLDTVLPGISQAQRETQPAGIVTNRLIDPTGAAASELTKQENLMLGEIKATQSQETAAAKEAAARDRQIAVEGVKADNAKELKGTPAAPKAVTGAAAATPAGRLASLTGSPPPTAAALPAGVRTPEEIKQIQTAIRVANTAVNMGVGGAKDLANIKLWQAMLDAHVAAGGKL